MLRRFSLPRAHGCSCWPGEKTTRTQHSQIFANTVPNTIAIFRTRTWRSSNATLQTYEM